MENKTKVIRCGLCKAVITIEGIAIENKCHGVFGRFLSGKKKKVRPIVAVAWGTFGFSIDGWGRRENILWSGLNDEICRECFDKIKEPIYEFKKIVEDRMNSNINEEVKFSITNT